jgi:hypothetical protein
MYKFDKMRTASAFCTLTKYDDVFPETSNDGSSGKVTFPLHVTFVPMTSTEPLPRSQVIERERLVSTVNFGKSLELRGLKARLKAGTQSQTERCSQNPLKF